MRIAAAVAALAWPFAAWLGFGVAGWRGGIEAAIGVLALVALAGYSALGGENGRRRRRPGPPPRGDAFPHFERFSRDVSFALSDGRYFERALAPRLREAARLVAAHRGGADLADDTLAARLGPEVWQLLSPREPPRDRDDAPAWAELDAAFAAIEAL